MRTLCPSSCYVQFQSGVIIRHCSSFQSLSHQFELADAFEEKKKKELSAMFICVSLLPPQILVALIALRFFQIIAYVVSIGLMQSLPTHSNT